MSVFYYRQMCIVDLDGVRFRFKVYDLENFVSPGFKAWCGRFGSYRYYWGRY